MKKSIYKKNYKQNKTLHKKLSRKFLKKKSKYGRKYTYTIIKIIKFIFLFVFIFLHKLYNNYSKALLEYYYINRLRVIKSQRRHYDESNLITFEDKLNWLAIHDVKKLKGKCADKILLSYLLI